MCGPWTPDVFILLLLKCSPLKWHRNIFTPGFLVFQFVVCPTFHSFNSLDIFQFVHPPEPAASQQLAIATIWDVELEPVWVAVDSRRPLFGRRPDRRCCPVAHSLEDWRRIHNQAKSAGRPFVVFDTVRGHVLLNHMLLRQLCLLSGLYIYMCLFRNATGGLAWHPSTNETFGIFWLFCATFHSTELWNWILKYIV